MNGCLTQLAVECKRHHQRSAVLHKLLEETEHCLTRADYVKPFTADDTLCENLKARLLYPRFIILGCNKLCKAFIANSLLETSVLPTGLEPSDSEQCGEQHIHIKSDATGVSVNSDVEVASPLYKSSYPTCDDDSLHRDSDTSDISNNSNLSSFPELTLQDSHLGCGSITVSSSLLQYGADIFIPVYTTESLSACMKTACHNVLPIVIYAFNSNLNERDVDDLSVLIDVLQGRPVFFMKSQSHVRSDLPEADRYSPPVTASLRNSDPMVVPGSPPSCEFGTQDPARRFIKDIGFDLPEEGGNGACFILSKSPAQSKGDSCGSKSEPVKGEGTCSDWPYPLSKQSGLSQVEVRSCYVETGDDLPLIAKFVHDVSTGHFIHLCSSVHELHAGLLNTFIITAFDMARDQMITPKRILFARMKEEELYSELLKAINVQQEEIREIIKRTIHESSSGLVTAAGQLEIQHDESKSFQQKSESVQIFVLGQLNNSIAEKLANSFDCLHLTFIDTIERCLNSLEDAEKWCYGETKTASSAFRDILNATYSVEITLQNSTRNLCKLLWEKLKQVCEELFTSCRHPFLHPSLPSQEQGRPHSHIEAPASPFHFPSAFSGSPYVGYSRVVGDDDSRGSSSSGKSQNTLLMEKIASETISKLSDLKLAKSICGQLRDNVKCSHEAFHSALANVDTYHKKRLMKAESQHLQLRKQHAPKLARLTMESLAMRDYLLKGMPQLGPEIGRGQYGVVYACEHWGGQKPCAIKSVVPPDDKHWNDLALEFFYTKSLPDHKRIVKLHGAVIDHNYGAGMSLPAVLLIMERFKRDLYTGIRMGLPWTHRLRIAIDVLEGIRFLHSQGLVHRDIKLKNVLLDDRNRAKITDLGFCKPEAMMSGSVVGTPIHMAPELFAGQYDSFVDVYAFGVLFWYICAGHVRLPQAFEACASKDQLWHHVRKGVRPEQLPGFDDECWDIMKKCWSGDPSQRPHLGNVQPRLEKLLKQYRRQRDEEVSAKAS